MSHPHEAGFEISGIITDDLSASRSSVQNFAKKQDCSGMTHIQCFARMMGQIFSANTKEVTFAPSLNGIAAIQ